jgi:hypothetical protein
LSARQLSFAACGISDVLPYRRTLLEGAAPLHTGENLFEGAYFPE